jgi:hypothetical protein
MSRRLTLLAGVVLIVLVAVVGTVTSLWMARRANRLTVAELRQQVAALEQERDALLARREAFDVRDQRIEGMPETPIRVMIPTSLAGVLIDKVFAGFADQVSLRLQNIRVGKSGSVRRVVTLGDYDLRVVINEVTGRIRTGQPVVTFGGNQIAFALPATIASGTGRATVNFDWDGRNISGAVCGDMQLEQVVTGTVIPATYQLKGAFTLAAKGPTVLLTPRVPPVVVKLMVKASDQSWAAAQKVLDDKRGLCGFVLDRVDVLGPVKGLIDRGFDVRLPTDRLRQLAMPVAIDSAIDVRGQRVGLSVALGGLAITPHAIWVGADVKVAASGRRPGS